MWLKKDENSKKEISEQILNDGGHFGILCITQLFSRIY